MTNYSDLENGRFRNPILFADYSDPDVIRVGDTYYMTASSFNYTPGLPILISHDLVNWKLVNYAIQNIAEERFNIPRHSEGVWAPAIRYHDGMFYIYYGMPDEGYYVVRTTDPLGKWEDPVCILEGKGLIDSCPFWDDDGKAYVIHGYAKSRIGFKSILGIFEMSSDGLKAISEDHFIFDGNDPKNPAVTIEGPKVYKRDGYYYIWAPAGGVKYGYQVVLRSRDIHGPYEIKEVMHTGNTVINGPHQGGLVDTVNGDEWFIHFQDRGLYGRICHLQPVHWENGWPVVGVNADDNGVGEPVYEMDKPDTGISDEPAYLQASDLFYDGTPGLMWQWLGNHNESFYGTVEHHETRDKESELFKHGCRRGLRLNALNPSGEKEPVIWKSANVLTQKIIYPLFKADIKVDATGLLPGDRTGVCMTGGQYMAAYIESKDNAYVVKVIESYGGDLDKKERVIGEYSFGDICKKYGCSIEEGLKNIRFSMLFDNDNVENSDDLFFKNVDDNENAPVLRIYLKLNDDTDLLKAVDLNVQYTPSDHTWVGAKIGIFALTSTVSSNADNSGYADFISVDVTKI
ncbi:xylosidase/arabinofuranosidase Xsa43C [Butyrivibrio proteoclasticus B316]|uniref:Xylosidase/arabinofuranosidase Xsa43C n=1 Tax=Butyrivibrio proteoclasticus (strain ATCC 51982 / DSM 14932 / B316) TaxID=515622 RepID=E0RV52_BUTPB|nr:glycoside hydrolase 43 family protein [Butyrivibrio proteoclasticus]ADL34322.1 xylosidase/arabinofuranosidase Xsa43C [Butyrivibrio proteoclasticus B316]